MRIRYLSLFCLSIMGNGFLGRWRMMRSPWGCAGLAMMLVTGCAPPAVTFVHAKSQRVEADGRLRAVTFESTFRTRGLVNEQLLYRVHLYTRDRRPIRSRDRHYELRGGVAGAVRSIMVVRSPQTFGKVRVAIPVEQLNIEENDLPAVAEIGLYRATGERMAVRQCRVPISSLSEVRPPLEAPPPDERSFWFVTGVGSWSGMLFGPYETEEQAAQVAPSANKAPRQISATEYVWVIPYCHTEDPKRREWIGPCRSQDDAQRTAEILRDYFQSDEAWEIRPPVMVRLATWLDQQAHQSSLDQP